ncbi:hypothetical protein AB0M83_26980 [Amycolatopsis sp. NPDC051106]|uniref:hypothetical protein n=1 Tax=Amycolatopsis sp. NPDC051106 TaxID=3157100 RepID=UPI0034182044
MLAAVADLEDALAAAKAFAVAAAGEAGAFHGDVAAALGVSRQAVSDRQWHTWPPIGDGRSRVRGRAQPVDIPEQQRRRTEHLTAAAGLAATLGHARRRSSFAAP